MLNRLLSELNSGNNKYTIRSIVCEASCHPVTQSFGHSVTTTLVTFPDSDIRLSIPILCFTIFWFCVPSMSLSAEKIADIPGVLASLSFRYCLMLSFFSFERGGVFYLSCSSLSFYGVRGSSALSSPIFDLFGF